MRLISFVFSILIVSGGTAFAQGTKDPSNNSGISNGSKPQTTTVDPSRPTTIRNAPTNMLPSGSGVQRVYRDGKLQTIVR